MELNLEELQRNVQNQLSLELTNKLKRSMFVDNWALTALVLYAKNTKSLINKLNKQYSKIKDVLTSIERLDRETRQNKTNSKPKKSRRKAHTARAKRRAVKHDPSIREVFGHKKSKAA